MRHVKYLIYLPVAASDPTWQFPLISSHIDRSRSNTFESIVLSVFNTLPARIYSQPRSSYTAFSNRRSLRKNFKTGAYPYYRHQYSAFYQVYLYSLYSRRAGRDNSLLCLLCFFYHRKIVDSPLWAEMSTGREPSFHLATTMWVFRSASRNIINTLSTNYSIWYCQRILRGLHHLWQFLWHVCFCGIQSWGCGVRTRAQAHWLAPEHRWLYNRSIVLLIRVVVTCLFREQTHSAEDHNLEPP